MGHDGYRFDTVRFGAVHRGVEPGRPDFDLRNSAEQGAHTWKTARLILVRVIEAPIVARLTLAKFDMAHVEFHRGAKMTRG